MNNLTDTQKIKRGGQIAARITGNYRAYGTQHQETIKTKAVKGTKKMKYLIDHPWLLVAVSAALVVASAVLIVWLGG